MASVWHGSRDRIETFNLEKAGRTGNASNGALGIWFSFGDDLAGRYAGNGGYLYELELTEEPEYRMTVRELMHLHEEAGDLDCTEREVEFYDRMRRDLISRGYARIHIVERSGATEMGIFLDPAKVRILSILHEECPLPSP